MEQNENKDSSQTTVQDASKGLSLKEQSIKLEEFNKFYFTYFYKGKKKTLLGKKNPNTRRKFKGIISGRSRDHHVFRNRRSLNSVKSQVNCGNMSSRAPSFGAGWWISSYSRRHLISPYRLRIKFWFPLERTLNLKMFKLTGPLGVIYGNAWILHRRQLSHTDVMLTILKKKKYEFFTF